MEVVIYTVDPTGIDVLDVRDALEARGYYVSDVRVVCPA